QVRSGQVIVTTLDIDTHAIYLHQAHPVRLKIAALFKEKHPFQLFCNNYQPHKYFQFLRDICRIR
ncbi:hypothetical protein, partial [Vibrio genomosp. F10]